MSAKIKKTPTQDKPKRKRGNPNAKKGVYPEWLKEYSFAVRPEHINRYGVPNDVTTLKKMIQNIGNEAIVVGTIGEGKLKTDVTMTRFERILFDWFNSQSFDKQQAIMQYGLGKVPDKLNISGELKVIKVALKKKQDTDGSTDS